MLTNSFMWKDPVTSHQKLFYVENVILIDNSLSYIEHNRIHHILKKLQKLWSGEKQMGHNIHCRRQIPDSKVSTYMDRT